LAFLLIQQLCAVLLQRVSIYILETLEIFFRALVSFVLVGWYFTYAIHIYSLSLSLPVILQMEWKWNGKALNWRNNIQFFHQVIYKELQTRKREETEESYFIVNLQCHQPHNKA
jgi:hypothetical protein